MRLGCNVELLADKGEVASRSKDSMLSHVPERRVLFVVLMVSTMLTMLAIGGIVNGFYGLSLQPIPEDAGEVMPGLDDEDRAVNLQFIEMILTDPRRRPLAAANLLVSTTVLIGSFMLSWRRKSALWWLKQAIIAKLLWITGYSASLAYHLMESGPFIVPGAPESTDATSTDMLMSRIVGLGVATASVHLLAYWRATRQDIRDFVDGKAS